MKVYVYIGVYIHSDKENEVRVFSNKENAHKFILDNVNAVSVEYFKDRFDNEDIEGAMIYWNSMWEDGRSENPEDEYYTNIRSPLADEIYLVETDLE